MILTWVVPALFAAVLSAAPQEPPPAAGTLCLLSASDRQIDPSADRCTDSVSLLQYRAQTKRDFVWFGADEIVIGTLPGGDQPLPLTEFVRVPFSITGTDPQLWPQRTSVDVSSSDNHRWKFVISPRQLERVKALRLPRGSYDVLISASHHRPVVRRVAPDPRASEFNLGRLTLTRLPVISGRILDARTREGLAGAEVLLPSGKILARSDGTGRFRGEILDQWPEYVRVTAPSRGTKSATVAHTEADTALQDIIMREAGALAITVTPATGSLEVDRVAGDALHPVTTRTIPDSGSVTIDDLDEGEYELVVRGDQPLQQHASFSKVITGVTTPVHIEIHPVPLHVTVRQRKEPLAGVRLEFVHDELKWRGSVSDLEKAAAIDAELWQQGQFTVFVSLPERGGYIAHTNLSGASSIAWDLDLPAHRILGKVVDGKTKVGLADVQVLLKLSTDKGVSTVWSRSGESGAFEFPFVNEGSAVLSASAPGYIGAQDVFDLMNTDQDRTALLSLERAHDVIATVTSSTGSPVIDAVVVDSSGDLSTSWRTDGAGAVSIPLREGETRTVFVIPREGSFALAQVSAAVDHTRIVVPAADATIRIEALSDSDGRGIPNVGFMIRYAGGLIPPMVAGLIAERQGFRMATDGTGTAVMTGMPSGVYEFYPVFNASDAQRVIRGMAEAKAQLPARPGTNQVTMTFHKR